VGHGQVMGPGGGASGAPAEAGDGPSGSSRRAPLIAGWAFVENGGADTGVSAVHVWAQPVTGGSPVFVGVATLGDARPEVAARYGTQHANAGFHLPFNNRLLPAGAYDIAVFAQGRLTGTFQIVRVVRMTVTP